MASEMKVVLLAMIVSTVVAAVLADFEYDETVAESFRAGGIFERESTVKNFEGSSLLVTRRHKNGGGNFLVQEPSEILSCVEKGLLSIVIHSTDHCFWGLDLVVETIGSDRPMKRASLRMIFKHRDVWSFLKVVTVPIFKQRQVELNNWAEENKVSLVEPMTTKQLDHLKEYGSVKINYEWFSSVIQKDKLLLVENTISRQSEVKSFYDEFMIDSYVTRPLVMPADLVDKFVSTFEENKIRPLSPTTIKVAKMKIT